MRSKTSRALRAGGAMWLLAMHYLDLYWVVLPGLRPPSASFHWLDFATMAGVALIFGSTLSILSSRSEAIPESDLRLAESLSFKTLDAPQRKFLMHVDRSILLLWTLGSLGCGHAADQDTESMQHAGHDMAASSRPELYEARGTLLWYEPGRVYLNHEAMPGFMDAMSMGFDVRDPALLEGIDPGTSVEFRVVVEGETFYVDQIYPLEE